MAKANLKEKEETKTVQKKRTKSSAKPKTATVQKKKTKKVTKAETPNKTAVKAKTKETPKMETPKTETAKEARILEGAELQEAIENQTTGMKVIETRSTNGKKQQRIVGKRKFKNPYGHFYGTIGSAIDRMIERGCFNKTQIKTFAGTKMTKVNSHIAHLRKDVGKVVIVDPKTKKVHFG